MIKGIGVDIACNNRFKKMVNNDALRLKILSKAEEQKYNDITSEDRKKEYLSSRFATKEALIKALKRIIPMEQISVLNNEDGSPYIDFEKKADEEDLIIHVTLSHEKENSVAFVILEK